jgi:hypothetical protein
MKTIDDKLLVLSDIGQEFNSAGVTWAVGASLLLYLNGKTDDFDDIDLLISEKDVLRVKELMQQFGALSPKNPNARYKTRHFLEYTIDGVDIDIMAGFVIVHDGIDHDCSLDPDTITSSAMVNNVSIPLHSLNEWCKYYEWMGRADKAAMAK